MSNENILVVDDDKDILEILSLYLKNSGYNVHTAENSKTALQKIQSNNYDLLILDIILPDLEGTKLCKIIRKNFLHPIIFISCMEDEKYILSAFKLGGDDYIRKPFNPNEVVARVNAHLRRVALNELENISPSEQIQINNLTIDLNKKTVFRKGKEIHLTPLEFDILLFMVNNQDTVLSYSNIYKKVWKAESIGDYRSVMVHVSNLRKKIENSSKEKYIITVKKRGYRFIVFNPSEDFVLDTS